MKSVPCSREGLDSLVEKGFIDAYEDVGHTKAFISKGGVKSTWALYQPLDLGQGPWVLVPPKSTVVWVQPQTSGSLPWGLYLQGAARLLVKKVPPFFALLVTSLLLEPAPQGALLFKPELAELVTEQWDALAPPPPEPSPEEVPLPIEPAPVPLPKITPRPAKPPADPLTQAALDMLGSTHP